MKRLLCIVGSMNAGGAETFLMKIYRKLDRDKYQFDFAVAIKEKGFYDDEIISMGGKIFHITPKSEGLLANFFSIKELVHNERYRYVLRTSQHSLSALELLASQFGGSKVRIFRSSNSNTTTGSKKQLLIHSLCKFMPLCFANVRIAPSTEAADFMFGKGSISKGKAVLIKNGIDFNYYKYNVKKRNEIRKELNIENKTVIGHVGRFNQQKNHDFLIHVFNEYLKINNNAILILVGIGETQDKIRKMTEELCIQNKVLFLGVRNDIPDLLSAMDIFIFPSLYEGMPNTVIEAQASGLPCLISDNITKEAKLTPNVEYLSLKCGAEEWAIEASKISNTSRQNMLPSEYDISFVVSTFVNTVFGIEDNINV